MSLNLNSKNKSQNLQFSNTKRLSNFNFNSNEKDHQREVNQLWSYFMTAFELDQFYKEEIALINGKPKESEKPSRTNAIKQLNEFLVRNKISYSDNYNLIPSDGANIADYENNNDNSLYCQDKTNFLLRNPKIWVIFIIIMSKSLDLEDTLKIFKNALNYIADQNFLFEFFLIFISKSDKNTFHSLIKSNKVKWPKEFVRIYKQERASLDEIFNCQRGMHYKLKNDKNDKNNTKNKFSNTEASFSNNGNNDITQTERETGICSFDEFSFHYKDNCCDDLDIENEEKLKCLMEIEDKDNNFFTEVLNDELIQDTPLNINMSEKTPTSKNLCYDKSENSKDNSQSPLFFNKSRTLDNYLLPSKDNKDNKEDEESFPSDKTNFNLEKALENFHVNNTEEEDYDDYNEEEMQIDDYTHNDNTPTYQEDTNNDIIIDINPEDFYNEDNLLLIDKNFKERNHFAVFILTNKLKANYNDKDKDSSPLYMITPIMKSFSENLYERLEVQKDLDEIRQSAYLNFIYFPYNLKLIELIGLLEDD